MIFEFGEGKIVVATGRAPGAPIDNRVLFFEREEGGPVGEDVQGLAGKQITVGDEGVFFEFHTPESVQVVIDALQQIKENLE